MEILHTNKSSLFIAQSPHKNLDPCFKVNQGHSIYYSINPMQPTVSLSFQNCIKNAQ